MSGAAVFGDAVFRSTFPVEEGFVTKVATPIRQATSEATAIGAYALSTEAESERLAFLVEPDLLYTANRQNAGASVNSLLKIGNLIFELNKVK